MKKVYGRTGFFALVDNESRFRPRYDGAKTTLQLLKSVKQCYRRNVSYSKQSMSFVSY